MKKTLFVLILFLTTSMLYAGDRFDLNNPEQVNPAQAVWIDFKKVNIDLDGRIIYFSYTWMSADGAMNINGRFLQNYACHDVADDPQTPEDETDTCWTDIFSFAIRAQDVGTPIGKGLRDLCMNRLKSRILTPGNDGTFED